MPIAKLPLELSLLGLINGGGINRSTNRLALPELQAWIDRNVVPVSSQGYSNNGVAWKKQNTNNLSTEPIRGGAVFQGKHIYAKGGNVYEQEVGLNAEALIASTVLDSGERVSAAKNRGTGVPKLYMCEGVNTPQSWDGTALSEVAAFNGTILAEIPSTSKPDKVYSFKDRLVWGYSQLDPFANYVLFSEFDNGDSYLAPGANTDAFFEEVEPGDDSYITGFGELKRNLEADQASQLLVFKPKKTYLGREIDFNGTLVSQTFDLQAFDMGTINHQSIVNFSNSLITLSRQGFASLDSATGSGGIDTLTYQFGIRVNQLIKESQLNANFEKAFMLHSPQKQVFIAFMPEKESTDANLNGYGYPEIPNNYAIAMFYGVQDKQGNPVTQWIDFTDVGFAACSGWVDENTGNIYIGSYFGDVYEIFVTGETEFERNPNTPSVPASVTSSYMTGDLPLDQDLDKAKTLKHLEFLWFTDIGVQANIALYYDQKEDGIIIPNQIAGSVGDIALYDDVAVYDDVFLYSFSSNVSMNLSPPGIGNTVRILVEWVSQIEVSPGVFRSNFAALNGMSSSVVELGGRNLKRRK